MPLTASTNSSLSLGLHLPFDRLSKSLGTSLGEARRLLRNSASNLALWRLDCFSRAAPLEQFTTATEASTSAHKSVGTDICLQQLFGSAPLPGPKSFKKHCVHIVTEKRLDDRWSHCNRKAVG